MAEPTITKDSSPVLEARGLGIRYGDFLAVTDVNFAVQRNRITAIIGPSGCGKTTLLRSFNRMNELVSGTRVEGKLYFEGQDLYDPSVDPVEVRYRIGMVFQRANPFPKSIFENVAWAARIHGFRGNLDELVESCLRQAALWDEVKDKLGQSGLALSGGQQQRLCIARTLAVQPEVILMDEPASALDPIATLKIEELMQDLKQRYTIVIVTHNMQQAARASDFTAMMMLTVGTRAGTVIEYDQTDKIFMRPSDKRTEDYVTGRFG
ncbi:MAG TPA: phosphate ABC transporter ATP-binding protein PstB [Anaerolineales bacterium]|nr:phosphate ABC transporter ATP-binding protein PstB [Anaerolineales bacterium]